MSKWAYKASLEVIEIGNGPMMHVDYTSYEAEADQNDPNMHIAYAISKVLKAIESDDSIDGVDLSEVIKNITTYLRRQT